jgi:predicted Ser/Thr protein kinase
VKFGSVLDERFVVQEAAGSGGMGDVFRARDIEGGALVALKVMRGADVDRERFEREARVLRALDHPRVVRYLGHGETPDGAPFLAMEWLEGEDLERRLVKSGLTTEETLTVGQGVLEALAHAHSRGVVHRDVKPSNVFLVGGRPENAKLLDFGIARQEGRSRALTRTGAVLGTAGYMAPEQASGSAATPRADIFALGCLLFECLTGRPAFEGATALAVLAKLLVGDPPRVRELRPSVAAALDEFTARLMSRDPEGRPADASLALAELFAVSSVVRSTSIPAPAPHRPALATRAEQRLYSVVLAHLRASGATPDATLALDDATQVFAELQRAAEQLGGQVVALGPVSAALALESRGSATDQAELAARAALDLVAKSDGLAIAIATGTAESTARGPSGPVLDRATLLLADASAEIRIDELSRSLLRSSFEIRGEREPFVLIGEKPRQEAHLLLGKPTPCVGRDRELALLSSSLAESADDGVWRAVLVTAAPGTGKSRLLAEFTRTAQSRYPEVRFVVARAEPARAKSALGLVRGLVMATLALDGSPVEPARVLELLRARLDSLGALEEPWAPFLGLLLDVDLGDGSAPGVLAAKNDPVSRRAAVKDAFHSYMHRWSSAGPAVVVLEDVHWADPASVEQIASLAQPLAERPVLAVVVARPDLTEQHPSLGREIGAIEVRLSGLTRRAGERLARAALGDAVPQATLDRIVALSDGNAFYLEELIRFVAEGRGAELPASVVAMAQVRLSGLDESDRELIRAASVFGERFDARAIAALVGADSADAVAERLERLRRAEVLERAPRDEAYIFRHALLLSAAYGMLPVEERPLAHRLAADHLIARGERDAALVAHHLLRANEPEAALPWLVRASHAALDAGDFDDARELAAQGLACGATGEQRGLLRACQAYADGMEGAWVRASEASREASSLLRPGSVEWFRSATNVLIADATLGQLDGSFEVLGKLTTLEVAPEPTGPYGRAATLVVSMLMLFGQSHLVSQIEERLDAPTGGAADAAFPVWRYTTQALASMVARADLGRALKAGTAAARLLPSQTDPLLAVFARLTLARVLAECGLYARAIDWLDEAEKIAVTGKMTYLADWARVVAAAAHLHLGNPAEADRRLAPLLEANNPIIRILGRLVEAGGALYRSDFERARELADAILDESGLPLVGALAHQVRARAALGLGDAQRALSHAELGLALRAKIGGQLVDRSWLQIAKLEALEALGRDEEAAATLSVALAELDAVANNLDDPEARRAYLEIVVPNARLRARAGRVH